MGADEKVAATFHPGQAPRVAVGTVARARLADSTTWSIMLRTRYGWADANGDDWAVESVAGVQPLLLIDPTDPRVAKALEHQGWQLGPGDAVKLHDALTDAMSELQPAPPDRAVGWWLSPNNHAYWWDGTQWRTRPDGLGFDDLTGVMESARPLSVPTAGSP